MTGIVSELAVVMKPAKGGPPEGMGGKRFSAATTKMIQVAQRFADLVARSTRDPPCRSVAPCSVHRRLCASMPFRALAAESLWARCSLVVRAGGFKEGMVNGGVYAGRASGGPGSYSISGRVRHGEWTSGAVFPNDWAELLADEFSNPYYRRSGRS